MKPRNTTNRFQVGLLRFTVLVAPLVAALVLPTGSALAQDMFRAFLSGGSEVPAAMSAGHGMLSGTYAEGVLSVEGSFSGLGSEVNVGIAGGAHIHTGYAGQNGGVALVLQATIDSDGLGGSFDAALNTFTLDEDQKMALMERRLYVNIHSESYPGGELRGQLVPAADAYYEVILSGGNGIPSAVTTAGGGLVGELNGGALTLTGSFSGMTSPAVRSAASKGAHIHIGEPGGIGGVVFGMNPGYSSNATSGEFAASGNTFWLTPGQIDQLNKRRYYVNIHSVQHKTGELRGQILPMSHHYFQAHFLGLHEIPPNMSGATGGAAGELLGNQLTVSGVFSMLNGDFDASIGGGAHLHLAGPDANGPVVVPLTTRLDGPTKGHFYPAENVFMLTGEQVGDLLAGNHYFNIHTTAYPGGELRSQFVSADNNAPSPATITSPLPGASVVAGGPANTYFVAEWEPVSDPDGEEVVYIWELSRNASFEGGEIRHAVNVGNQNQFSVTIEDLDALLAAANVPTGSTRVFYHRVISSDGSVVVAGPGAEVRVTRGDVLDPLPTSRVQIVHAAADPAAAEVDVYLGDVLALNDFAYKTATPFLDLPAGVEVLVGVAGSGSTSSADAIATFPVMFEAGKTYHVVAAGVLDPTAFAPNPDGIDIGFDLFVAGDALEASTVPGDFDVRMFHAITDAPTVDFREAQSGVFRENQRFGVFSDWVTGTPDFYTGIVQTTPGSKTLLTIDGDFKESADAAVLEVAVGFLGLGYGADIEWLWVLPDGSTETQPLTRASARAQIVHASPDPAAALVDVYLDNLLALDDFAYRTGTPFIDLPASYPIAVGVAPSTSASKDDAIATFEAEFANAGTYGVVAAGVLDPGSIASNPDGLDTGFKLYVSPEGLARETWPSTTSLGNSVFHAVPDAPSVDIVGTDAATNERFLLWTNVGYGDWTGGLEVQPSQGPAIFNLTPVGDNTNFLYSGYGDLSVAFGKPLLTLVTGLFNPTGKNADSGIRQVNILPDGSLLESQVVTGPSDADDVPAAFALHGNYPNPFNPSTAIVFDLPETASVSVEVFDAIGRRALVITARDVEPGTGNSIDVDASRLVSGLYLYRLIADGRTKSWSGTGRMLFVK